MSIKSERIDQAVEIINYAVENKISVKAASIVFGHSDTYVKNVKAVVSDLYAQEAISDELFSKFNVAYKKSKNESVTPTSTQKFKQPEKPKDIPKINDGEQTTFTTENNEEEATIDWTWGANYPPDHIKTLPELLEACEVDTKIWSVESHIVNKWDTSFKVNDVPVTIQNFQVKARLIRNKFFGKEAAIGDMFVQMVQDYIPPVLTVIPESIRNTPYPPQYKQNNLFEVSCFDLHLGKLAWFGETHENYDVKIARQRFLQTIETLILRASGFQYSRILFPVGSDFFNSDNMMNTTTKGTQQDEDLRWQKTFAVGVRLLVDAINMLKQTGVPVDVKVIPGNHDFERSFYLGSYLEAWFNSDPMVNIDNGASPRKYYRFGNVLLGLTHGGEEKETSLPLIMASDVESKPLWSETIFHEWHLGHIHRKRNVNYAILDRTRTVNEDLGVTVRYLSSLTGTEEWHHKKGFIGAIKAGEGFIWNDETGLMAHINSNYVID